MVANPYDRATRVWIIGQQTNPLYRTYLETTWLWLEPGQSKQVRVMVEYALDPKSDRLPDDLRHLDRGQIEKLSRMPNDLGLHAYAENPHDDPRHSLELMGGAGVQVGTGRATDFERFGNDGNVVFGSIATSDDHIAVWGGTALITVTDEPGAHDRYHTFSGPVEDGSFFV